MAAWILGIVLGVAIVWTLGTLYGTVREVRRVLESRDLSYPLIPANCETGLKALGSGREAARKLVLYSRMPDRIAPYKDKLLVCFRCCGEGGAPIVVPELLKALKNKDEGVRCHAAENLGMLKEAAGAAVPDLVLALHDEHPLVRASAALALGMIGDPAIPAIPALIAALGDEHESVRCWASFALGGMGPEAASAVPELKKLLKDKVQLVRSYAGDALEAILGERVKEPQDEVETDEEDAAEEDGAGDTADAADDAQDAEGQ